MTTAAPTQTQFPAFALTSRLARVRPTRGESRLAHARLNAVLMLRSALGLDPGPVAPSAPLRSGPGLTLVSFPSRDNTVAATSRSVLSPGEARSAAPRTQLELVVSADSPDVITATRLLDEAGVVQCPAGAR
jgi:hypothetical protein